MIFKAALASQGWPSCSNKPLSIQTLRHLKFLSNVRSSKFKLSVSGKKNVRLFGVITKNICIPSEKNVPLLEQLQIGCYKEINPEGYVKPVNFIG